MKQKQADPKQQESIENRGRIALFGTTRGLCFAALLAAMSLILGKFLQIPNPVQEMVRISFENLPIILAGMTMGPVIGALTGAVADLVGCLAYGYTINPIITLGAAAVGLVAGLCGMLIRRPLWLRVGVSVAAAHLCGSVWIKSIGLAAWYLGKYGIGFGTLVLWRLGTYAVIGVAEGAIIYALFRNRAFAAMMHKISHRYEAKKRSMTYEEALAYIHSVNWKGSRLGLSRIRELLEKLGNPQNGLKFVHIAGTNGKGSVSAMTESVLRACGYRTGLFVSPYIKCFTERIQCCGEPIPPQMLADLTAKVKPVADGMKDSPTEFELVTAIGFLYFKEQKCDVVVLEVGMGGRLDSTNIIQDPLLTVITGISMDHTAILGDTVEKIAAEKAGIIKPGVPIIWGGDAAAARGVIALAAKEKGADFVAVSNTPVMYAESSLSGTTISRGEWENVHIPLLGTYQVKNLATVLEIVSRLRQAGLDLPERRVREGLSAVRWPGRFEKLCDDPLVISDGAHNPEGIAAAVQSIRTYFGSRKVLIVTGMLADKAYGEMVRLLAPVSEEVFTLTPENPRALSAADLAEEFHAQGVCATAFDSIPAGVCAGLSRARESGLPLISLGSLYMYGDVSDAVKKSV